MGRSDLGFPSWLFFLLIMNVIIILGQVVQYGFFMVVEKLAWRESIPYVVDDLLFGLTFVLAPFLIRIFYPSMRWTRQDPKNKLRLSLKDAWVAFMVGLYAALSGLWMQEVDKEFLFNDYYDLSAPLFSLLAQLACFLLIPYLIAVLFCRQYLRLVNQWLVRPYRSILVISTLGAVIYMGFESKIGVFLWLFWILIWSNAIYMRTKQSGCVFITHLGANLCLFFWGEAWPYGSGDVTIEYLLFISILAAIGALISFLSLGKATPRNEFFEQE